MTLSERDLNMLVLGDGSEMLRNLGTAIAYAPGWLAKRR